MQQHIIDQIIRSRRSVYPEMYEQQGIADDLIDTILENANWAPNHRLTEPWRFKIFKNESLKVLADFLGDAYKLQNDENSFSEMKHKKIVEKVLKSACVIAVCFQRDPEQRVPEEEELLAMGAAIQNMWLTCSSYGIGCYLSTPSAIRNISKIVHLAEGERCVGLFYMGWAKENELKSQRTPVSEKIVRVS